MLFKSGNDFLSIDVQIGAFYSCPESRYSLLAIKSWDFIDNSWGTSWSCIWDLLAATFIFVQHPGIVPSGLYKAVGAWQSLLFMSWFGKHGSHTSSDNLTLILPWVFWWFRRLHFRLNSRLHSQQINFFEGKYLFKIELSWLLIWFLRL